MSTWQGTVTNGYTVDKAGGNTIIVFATASMYATQITTLAVGDLIAVESTLMLPDGRVWFKYVNPYVPNQDGWVVGYGNTGVIYVTPLNSGDAEDLNIGYGLKYPLPVENTIPKPFGEEVVTLQTVGASYNPTTSIEAKVYSELPPNIPPIPSAPSANASKLKNYTEGVEPLSDGVTIEHGLIKMVGVVAPSPGNIGNPGTSSLELYNSYIASPDMTQGLDAIKKNFGIFPNSNIPSLKSAFVNKFNRFKLDFPDYHLNKTFSHVFFTRPDLNLYNQRTLPKDAWTLIDTLANDPSYYYLDQSDQQLLSSLTGQFSREHDLNPFLSNLADSFEISDEYIKTVEHGETLTGYKIQYGRHNIESKTAGTISINYIDDKNLSIYKLHKAWVEYISRVYRGALSPRLRYIQDKVLDYTCSVYYILCGPDAETILFWSKYYGLFPTHTPSSAYSWSKGSMIKAPDYNISYSYATKEDFNPIILTEFNENSRGAFTYKKIFIPELGQVGTSFSGNPYIESVKTNGDYSFKLRFRDDQK